ncbi:DUF5082 family protein [Bacillus sp. HSf4]|uniref:YwqH-like family protein n=1 Tax=Bacillus sp. HSf4 TaxID=3035514 RepID=UPI002409C53E|nr:DUF5082 family protein [Bacillus sp. HSf4]WFA05738.1 DUF5082 family protein [Bacillus sp. HSf4]
MIIWEKTVLYGMQGTLVIKKEQLKELKHCKSELTNIKEEFSDSKSSIKKPGLSSTTWQGSLADSFKSVRSDMKTAYNDIYGKQLNEVFKKLNERINSLNDEIHSLGQDISSLKKKIEKLEKEEKQSRH